MSNVYAYYVLAFLLNKERQLLFTYFFLYFLLLCSLSFVCFLVLGLEMLKSKDQLFLVLSQSKFFIFQHTFFIILYIYISNVRQGFFLVIS